ncbi:MAG: glycosyltransferase [Cyclobacteriaceae bacterium]
MTAAAKSSIKNKKITKKEVSSSLLVEIAWETVNQVGGIYTVIRSKAPTITKEWGSNYCLLGPYMPQNVAAEFDPIEDAKDPFAKAVATMNENGYKVHYGHWLVTGRPKVVLFDLKSVNDRLGDIKYSLWQDHGISMPGDDFLLNGVVMFGEMVKIFLMELAKPEVTNKTVIAHFHEWMAASGLPSLRKNNVPIKTVFTTHATMLGRYLAMNDPQFYDHLPYVDWAKEAKHFNIEANVQLERAAAHSSHVFTTVSEVTAEECRYLLGREPDVILPNGINNERFEALHEFQNLHMENKEKIHQFVMAHFFQSYTFDLDNTLYFFTSGRYEYLNKGYDLTLEALARLNYRLQKEGSDTTIVMFFITKQPYHSINPEVLHTRALMEELRTTVEAIKKQVGDRLFFRAASSMDTKLPPLNEFVDDYWRLRYRRTLQSWKAGHLPPVVTHNLKDDKNDSILNFLRSSNLINNEEDRVKIVYHPDFISYTNPLFGMEYGQFVRGTHMGIFPSYYEPWGYTPLECIASGVPTATSDLAGFGDYVKKNMPNPDKSGIYVVNRDQKSFDDSANQLANVLYQFVQLNRRERITLRNRTESSAVYFDWDTLTKYYSMAYHQALHV